MQTPLQIGPTTKKRWVEATLITKASETESAFLTSITLAQELDSLDLNIFKSRISKTVFPEEYKSSHSVL